MKVLSRLLKALLPLPIFLGIREAYRDISYFLKIGIFFKKRTTVTISAPHGSFYIITDPKNHFVDGYIFKYKKWDTHIASILDTFLTEESVFVDIGANIGYFTLYAAKICTQGEVIAFEPIKRLASQMKESINTNACTNIEVHQLGCGAKREEKTIFIDERNVGGATLLKDQLYQVMDSETIKVVPADLILKDKERIDLIKIDVEGFELSVLQGLQETIEKHLPAIIMEFSPLFYTHGEGEEILATLFAYGYEITDSKTGQHFADMATWHAQARVFEQTDIVCIPKK